MIRLGDRIKELRQHDGRTQEYLAGKLGVTAQAISRWENGICYPDMELVPSIANCFGVTIDELFGYRNDREQRIDAILKTVDGYDIQSRADDEWIEPCLAVLREGLIEFPRNEKLLVTLCDTLSEAGWRRFEEWTEYDDEGFLQHRVEIHRENPFWDEAVKVGESLLASSADQAVVAKAVSILIPLYRNLGKTQKAVACAERMPRMRECRELLLAMSTDGKENAKYTGMFLLEAARLFSDHLIYGLMANRRHFESDLPVETIQGAINLFRLLCGDGNYGVYHDALIKLNLYLSRVQWERGYHDAAFESLDEALVHAKALERVLAEPKHRFTAPLVSFVETDLGEGHEIKIAEQLPEDWPFWSLPDCSAVAAEIKDDPRWAAWVARTKA